MQSGSVSLGGVDLRQIAPEELLKNYSIVFQDVVLFNDSIYNNIKIGREDATEEEVYAAAKLAAVTNLFTVSRTDTKPLSAKTVRPSPAANGSGFLSPGRF